MSGLLLLFGIILALVGLVLLIVGRQQKKRAEVVATWPTVPGVVLNAEIRERESVGGEDDTVTTTMYEPVVEYRYAVSGQDFTSSQYRLGAKGLSYGMGQAKKVLERYPKGGAVTVHYNPMKPDQAVLELGSASSSLLAVVGGVFLGIGVILTIAGLLVG